MKKINIGYISSMYPRSNDTYVRNEVIELRKRGHYVQTFSIRKEKSLTHISDEISNELATTNYILEQSIWKLLSSFLHTLIKSPLRFVAAFCLGWKTRVRGVKGSFLLLAYLIEACYLARELERLGIEVLHNHIAENSAMVSMLASCLSKVPYSMTVHGPGIFYRPEQMALGEKIARSTFTVAITNFCKSQCMLFTPMSAWKKINVIRCAPSRDFENIKISPVISELRFVFVGRLSFEKGLIILLEAVREVAKRHPNVHLDIIGDGPLKDQVQTYVGKYKLENNILLHGPKSSLEVREYLINSRGMVLPSFAEGLPVSIMESFALGRPVISTMFAGIPELVSHGQNGWLTYPGSVESLVDVMNAAIETPVERLTEMGMHGYQQLQRLHSLDREVTKLEALLVNTVKNKQNSSLNNIEQEDDFVSKQN